MDAHNQLDQRHENISALSDGELAAGDVELAFAALDTPEGWATWTAYHQIGQTLRSEQAGAELSDGFSARLAAALAAEPPLSSAAAETAGDVSVRPAKAASASLP